MTKKPTTSKDAADKVVKNIRRKTRQTYSSEEKIRIVLAGLRGEESIAVLCRREGIAESLYYSWFKEFLEAGSSANWKDKNRRQRHPALSGQFCLRHGVSVVRRSTQAFEIPHLLAEYTGSRSFSGVSGSP